MTFAPIAAPVIQNVLNKSEVVIRKTDEELNALRKNKADTKLYFEILDLPLGDSLPADTNDASEALA